MRGRRHTEAWLWAAFIIVVSYVTYVRDFENPPQLFWDENYHVASAQKYLNGVFFMEPHPPLGKLLIALGEAVVRANPSDDQFIGTDYAKDVPAGFSFAGYRLVPVLFGWLTAPVLYACFLLVTRRPAWAGFGSFLYVFDNALIVHSRASMLDSTLLLFSTLTILGFLVAYGHQAHARRFWAAAVLFGIAFAGVMLTKALGLVLVLLLPLLLIALWPNVKRWCQFVAFAVPAFTVVYVLVWSIHFGLATRIVPSLPNDGLYGASPEYRALLERGHSMSALDFPVMLRDSLAYPFAYTQGVPRLDLSNPDENGSPFFLWPLGARSISYRWETQDDQTFQYLYLQVNPVVWLTGLIGVLASGALLIDSAFVRPSGDPRLRFLTAAFLGLYVAYMLAVSRFERVMYLYHYFLPLVFSFFLFLLALGHVRRVGPWRVGEATKTIALVAVGALIVVAFRFYRPLTYYEPMTDAAVQARAIFPLWELHCARCPRESVLVVYKHD